MPDMLMVDGWFCDHEKMTCAALARGIHVYCDKPLALTLDGLVRIRQTVENSSALLWPRQTARYDAWFYTAKTLIAVGQLGDMCLLTAQKSYRLGERTDFFRKYAQYSGLIPWIAIHGIDFIRYLCLLEVRAIFAHHYAQSKHGYGDLEVSAQLMMTQEGEVSAQVSADCIPPANALSHGGDDRVRAAGTQGVIEVRDEQVWLINRDHDGSQSMPIKHPPMIFEAFMRSDKVDINAVGLQHSANQRLMLASKQ